MSADWMLSSSGTVPVDRSCGWTRQVERRRKRMCVVAVGKEILVFEEHF